MSIFQKGVSKFADSELRDLRHSMAFFFSVKMNRDASRLKPSDAIMAFDTLEKFLWALEKEFPKRAMEQPYEEEF